MEDRQEKRVLTVSQVTVMVKSVLESSLSLFWVEGEISNFVHHSSGHMYFTLKDEGSQLSSIMFKYKNARLAFAPENGMKVVAWGGIKVYEPAGRYQLYVEEMRPAGIGALAAAYEKLKRRLEDEGLFDSATRKPLPEFPKTVAVVTSPTGAAVRDVIRVVRARYPLTRLVVVPTRVQGADAIPEIVAAIEAVDTWGEADVMVVGRGGGSLEDLWAFNDESVARAIFASRTPIISAVGHEVDFTISDFVADMRAATPSHAGEIAVRDRADLKREIERLTVRLEAASEFTMNRLSERLRLLETAYGFRLPTALVERLSQSVDELARRSGGAVRIDLERAAGKLERLRTGLRLSDPARIMARGYAAVGVLPSLKPVRSADDVRTGVGVRVTLADGRFDGTVGEVTRRRGREH